MNGSTYKYDEEDDWGLPRHREMGLLSRLRFTLRLYKTPILIATAILAFLWWTSGRVHDSTDWSRFAYVQYVTDAHSMCNAYMVFEALKRLGSKAERVLMFPEEWNAEVDDPNDRNSQLLVRAEKKYGVTLKPVQLLGLDGAAKPGTFSNPSSWEASITKLRAFELEEYDRVLHLDNDITVLQHMDELFTLPSTPIAMPRAYWDDPHKLTSLIMLIEPNADETKNMFDTLQKWRLNPDRDMGANKYDMEILNDRFGDSAMVLPHRPYALLTAEFRNHNHSRYLGTTNGPTRQSQWDPEAVLKEAKLVHFSDWPLPKPWIMWPNEGLMELQPDCGGSRSGGCREREIWKGLYDDFRHRRRDLCRVLSVPAPTNWQEWKNRTGAAGPGPA